MRKIKSKQKMKNHKVDFIIEAAEAKQVFLVGDFNNWDPMVHPMEKNDKGIWKKTLKLAPHKYEYRFLVDGHWKENAQDKQTCPNSFRTADSVFPLA